MIKGLPSVGKFTSAQSGGENINVLLMKTWPIPILDVYHTL